MEFLDYSAAARGDQEKMLYPTSLFTDIYFIDMEVWVGRGEMVILERRFPTPNYLGIEMDFQFSTFYFVLLQKYIFCLVAFSMLERIVPEY